MSELDNLYREVILDHYKNPRGHGVIDPADAEAEGLGFLLVWAEGSAPGDPLGDALGSAVG